MTRRAEKNTAKVPGALPTWVEWMFIAAALCVCAFLLLILLVVGLALLGVDVSLDPDEEMLRGALAYVVTR